MRIDGEDDLIRALGALSDLCPRMARIIAAHGAPPLRRREPGFKGLAEIIVFQQVSVEAGRAIMAKAERALGGLSAEAILAADDATMRAGGLSGPKIRALRAIAEAIESGAVDLDAFETMDPDESSAILTTIKGVGPWTADIYLLSCLGHADAWPTGDLALQQATADLLGLDVRPGAEAMMILGARWRPYRAVAARMLWRFYGVQRAKNGAEPTVNPV